MIQVPVPPKALSTRQITCICCHEQFTIAVDEPNRRRAMAGNWHVPTDQFHSTQLRYEADRHRRQASPTARAVPEPNPEHSPHRDPTQFYFVTCPRCGADNRNWLNFQARMPFRRQYTLWIGLILTVLAVGMIVALLFNPAVLPNLELNKWTRWLPLIIAVILAGILPLLLIPGLWYPMRIRNHLSQVAPNLTESASPATLRALLIWAVLALLLPFVAYVVPPVLREVKEAIFDQPTAVTLVARIDAVSKQVNQLDESAPVNNAFAGLTAVLNTQLRACEKTQIDQMIADLQAIAATSPHGNLLLINSATSQLQVIREMADISCRRDLIDNVSTTLQPIISTAAIQPLPAELTLQQCRAQWQAANAGQNVIVDPTCYNFLLAAMLTDLGRIKESQMPIWTRAGILAEARLLAADPNLLPGVQSQIAANMATLENSLPGLASAPLLNLRFLVFWFTAVTLVTLLCTICAFLTLDHRIDQLDPHVPRPIFTNIASMTRVAVWEAKQALEIDGFEHRIQWTRAIRNEAGGIDLVGFFRDPPELLPDGTMSSQVRAQRYGISTDMWCRIREARITDMMTQRPAGGPAFALPEFAPTTAIVTVGRERR
ncbi:MAG: hypothetical protein KF770_04540 [Anaerolineae bacterium]|nr:hypothetical protein [Anaerolineae bacterium]